jgi:DNA-directed RNA polymerase specialized sigma24 family protein
MTKHKVTVQEAAEVLDTSVDAVRQRIKRGKLLRAEADDPADSRVYVWLDADRSESRHEVEGEPAVNLGAMVETLQDEVRYLREQLDQEREANRENRRLLAAALERIPPQIEAPRAERESPESPGPSDTPTETPGAGGGPQTGTERRWWEFWR